MFREEVVCFTISISPRSCVVGNVWGHHQRCSRGDVLVDGEQWGNDGGSQDVL